MKKALIIIAVVIALSFILKAMGMGAIPSFVGKLLLIVLGGLTDLIKVVF